MLIFESFPTFLKILLVVLIVMLNQNKCIAQGMSISGRIFDSQHKPVDHMSVQILDEHGNLRRATFTDQEGNFTADRLTQGNFDVAIASISQELARKRKVLTGSKNVEFIVPLVSIAGTVQLPDGKPAKGASVKASSIDWAIDKEMQVGSNGNFRIEQLPPAIFEITASAPGCKDVTTRVDLSKTTGPVSVKLESFCQIEIQVLEKSSRKPLPHVVVNTVEPRAGIPTYRFIGETNANGTVVDRQAKPGTVKVVASNPLHESADTVLQTTPDKPGKVVLYLDRSGSIFVRIPGISKIDPKASQIYARPWSLIPAGDINGYSGDFTAEGYKILLPPGRYTLFVYLTHLQARQVNSLCSYPPKRVEGKFEVDVFRGKEATVTMPAEK